MEQHNPARVTRGLRVALAGAILGVALWAIIGLVYSAVLNLGPQPSTTEVRWVEVATLLILASWAAIVAAAMALVQRWWQGARMVTYVAGAVVLVVGGVALTWTMSFLNECEAGHSFPLPGLHC